MNRSIAAGLCLAMVFGVCENSNAGDPVEFSLSIDAPAELLGSAGRTVEIDATVSVATSGLAPEEPGVQGWSLSLAPVGW